MYDGLRVLVLGACNLNDTVYFLEKNTDHLAANSNGNARRLEPKYTCRAFASRHTTARSFVHRRIGYALMDCELYRLI
jgi:hypothetical protein